MFEGVENMTLRTATMFPVVCISDNREHGGNVWQKNQATYSHLFCALQFSSVQDGIYVLWKAHMRSTPSLRSFPNVAFEKYWKSVMPLGETKTKEPEE